MDLSPGTYHTHVPTDPLKNLKWRRHVVRSALGNPRLQAELIEACRRDIVFWINTFVWQVNPRKFGDEIGPFVLFPFQERVLRKTLHRLYVEQQAMIWEKSRYQGATWLMLLKDDWLALFHKTKSFLLVSHTEDAVYKGDDDSLFKKLEFVHAHLPDWMLRGADRKASAKRLTMAFPKTGGVISGGANTSRVGVSQRMTSVDCDEFAKQPNATDILSNTADTGARLFVSTHYGVGTTFYGMTSVPGAVKEVMHWSENPMQNAGLYRSDPGLADHERPVDKTYEYPPDFQFVRDGKPHGGPFPGLRSPWYDTEVVERIRLGGTERDIAMHLDIDAQGSTFQFFTQAEIGPIARRTCRPGVRHEVTVDPAENTATVFPSESGRLWLWCDLDWNARPPEGDYVIAADCAAGTGATPTCFSIGLAVGDKVEKVGAYVDPFSEPHEYAPVFIGLGKLFHRALLIWETPGPGAKLGEKVIDSRYSRVYWRPKNALARVKEASQKPGWHNQKDTATLLLRNYKEALVSGRFINRCELALAECLDYVYADGVIEHTGRKDAKGDPSGARENHGDRVIADGQLWLGFVSAGLLREFPVGEEPVRPGLHPGSRAGREAMARAALNARPQAGWLTRVGAR